VASRLDGVTLKIERAKCHYYSVQEFVEDFTKEAFQGVLRREFDSQSGEHRVELVEVKHPGDALGILIGDLLHNARSALDHLAFQLVHHPTVDPGVPKAKDCDIAFPICDSPKAFKSAVKKIQGAAPDALTAIERLQPYCVRQDAPERVTLSLLRELNDWDKHRLLHTAENYVAEIGFAHSGRLESSEVHPPGVLEKGAELASWKVRPGLDPKVDVGFYIASGVTFDQGPASRENVLELLSRVLNDTFLTIATLSQYVAA
jgi:hypothetical protein